MAETVVFQEFNLEDVHLKKPVVSEDGKYRSSHVKHKVHFQIGEMNDMKAVVVQEQGRGMVLRIKDDSAVQFLHGFESYLTDYVYDHCEEWFGRKVERANVRRMLSSVLKRDDVILQKSPNMTAYKLVGESNEVVELESLDDVDNSWVVPIIEFRGLYITSRIFAPSFFVSSILVGSAHDSGEASFFDPQSLLHRHEDLPNPFDIGVDWEEVSHHSADGETNIFSSSGE